MHLGPPSHRRRVTSPSWRLFVFLLLIAISTIPSFAQQKQSSTAKRPAASARKPSAVAPKKAATPVSAAQELQSRIDAAASAQQAGTPEQIETANRKLIGLAMRRVASLRVYEGAFPEAIDLYKRSLEFEEIPDARVDLAIAEMRAQRMDDALHEVSTALTAAPRNARAWHVQGKVLMMKKDYRAAAEPLAHSLELQPDLEAAYALGITWLHLHEQKKTALLFQQMLDVGGDRAGFHVLFARAYRDAEYMDAAERELHRAIAMDPKATRAHYFLGLLYMVRNEWAPTPAAVEQFQAEIRKNPNDFFGNYFMGVICSGERKFDDSDRYLKVAAAARPDWPEPWLYLGLNASGRNDKAAAEPLLRKAIQLTGSDEARNNYQIRRAYYSLGRLLMSEGKRDEGAAALEHSRTLQEKTLDQSHQKLSGMGGVSGAVEPQEIADAPRDETAVATSTTDPAAELNPSVVAHANLTEAEKIDAQKTEKQLRAVLGNALNDLGTAEARTQNYDIALVHFREAQKWDATIPVLNRNIGIAAVRLNRYADALPALSHALSEQPQDGMTRSLLGLSLYMTDQYEPAAKTFAPLGQQVLADPALAYAAATSFTKAGDIPQGKSLLDELEKKPLPAELSVSIGQTRSDAGDYEGALKSLQRALATSASVPKAHYYAGLALIRLDRPADAARELRQELGAHPDDPDAQYHLAYALLQLSSKEEAMRLLKGVVNAHPEHAEAHYQLGKALLDDGQLKPAIEQLEIAARLKPQLDYVHYQLQAAYRKDARLAEADRELNMYRELKARNRQRTAPQPEEHP